MSNIGSFEVLSKLAEHNQWANQKIFNACSNIKADRLIDESHGYDSVIGILNHLVQVEHSCFLSTERLLIGAFNFTRMLFASID